MRDLEFSGYWEGEAVYGRSGFQCSSINPKPFAIVYYAENKKRLVPMDGIEKVER